MSSQAVFTPEERGLVLFVKVMAELAANHVNVPFFSWHSISEW